MAVDVAIRLAAETVGADERRRPEFAGLRRPANEVEPVADALVMQALGADHISHSLGSCGGDQRARLGDRSRHRLFGQHMLAGPQTVERDGPNQRPRHDDDDRIDGAGVQHLGMVAVGMAKAVAPLHRVPEARPQFGNRGQLAAGDLGVVLDMGDLADKSGPDEPKSNGISHRESIANLG